MGKKSARNSAQYATLALLAVLLVPELAWSGSIVLSAELGQAQRDFSIGDYRENSDDYQVLAGLIGFELQNSLLYLGYRTEETTFAEGLLPYERQEATLEWHWNETTEKDNYLTASFGFFNTSYSFGTAIDEDFFGLALGAGGTKDLVGGRLFLTGSFKIKLPYTDDPKFLSDTEDSRFFLGYEARGALGIYLDSEGLFALQLGYRMHQIDFDGVFVDDESEGVYVLARVFIPGD